MAGIVQFEQRLLLRWPIGDEAVRMAPSRRTTADGRGEAELRAAGWTFARAELEASGAFGPTA
jgi:hypothetical protein